MKLSRNGKKAILSFIVIILSTAWCYGCGAFIAATFDITQWDGGVRFIVAFLASIGVFFGPLLVDTMNIS